MTGKKANPILIILVSILALGLAGLLAWGLVVLWSLFWGFISHSQSAVGAAVITICGTVLLSLVTFVLTKRADRRKDVELKRKEIEQEHRKEKTPTYTRFIEFFFKTFNSQKGIITLTPEESFEAMQNFTKEILIWGSDSVIKDYIAFREHAALQEKRKQNGENLTNTDTVATVLIFEKLLYDIRADLGHENKGLGEGDLSALIVNDFHEELKKARAQNP